jgi:hypothetical protein
MAFTKVPENLKLRRQLNCSISEDDWERWYYLCQRNQTTSHELLRRIVKEYIQNNAGSGYSVLDVLSNR